LIFAGSPRTVLRQAEADLMARRAAAADMAEAVLAALGGLDGAASAVPGAAAAGQAIAAAVATHRAQFPPGREPPYHDMHHQAHATVAMGWLCAEACRRNALTPAEAVGGILAMAGHDLLHDGSVPQPGVLEARSADATAALAAGAGVAAPTIALIRRIIAATDPHRPPDPADLPARLAREADLFESITPDLGWRLGAALAREWRAAGSAPEPPIDSYAGRLAFLRALPPTTAMGRVFGLEAAVADQLAALAALGAGAAEAGAARLDALPAEAAQAAFRQALGAVGGA